MSRRRTSGRFPGSRSRAADDFPELSWPIVSGADVELGNFREPAHDLAGPSSARDTCSEAARALLREVRGAPLVSPRHAVSCRCPECDRNGTPPSAHGGWWSGYGGTFAAGGTSDIRFDPQDFGRRFTGNGGCAYIDLDHLEICIPEAVSAREHVAAWRAMVELARQAMHSANARCSPARRLHVVVGNSDGFGNSYGSHLSFLVRRRTWDDLFHRRLHLLLPLVAHQVSSIVLTGAGKVGAENGRPAVEFQLSQRADFFETLTGQQTTFHRPLANSRDEPLCGAFAGGARRSQPGDPARLHVIFYDSTLGHVSNLLKVGCFQMILAMHEAGWVDTDLALEDPLEAAVRFSHDPSLRATCRTIDGRRMTAVEMQQSFLERARQFAEQVDLSAAVPGHLEILDLWEETLTLLARRDFDALARRLDWALKLVVLRDVLAERPDLDWTSPEIKHLDLMFGHLDRDEGLYWAYESAGAFERIVPEEQVARLTVEPPEDSRAWTRAMLIRRVGPERIDDVDWDRVRVRTPGAVSRYRTVDLPGPLDFTRDEVGALFAGGLSLDDLLDALGATAPSTSRYGRAGSNGAG